MKKNDTRERYVYLIREKDTDKVVYVGETINPKRRFYQHTCSCGDYDRKEHYYEIHSEHKERKDAISMEAGLKKEYGIPHTESSRAWHWNKPKPIKAYYKGDYVGEYYAIKECSRQLNLNKPNIVQVLRGWTKQYKGYTFEYVNPEDNVARTNQ